MREEEGGLEPAYPGLLRRRSSTDGGACVIGRGEATQSSAGDNGRVGRAATPAYQQAIEAPCGELSLTDASQAEGLCVRECIVELPLLIRRGV